MRPRTPSTRHSTANASSSGMPSLQATVTAASVFHTLKSPVNLRCTCRCPQCDDNTNDNPAALLRMSVARTSAALMTPYVSRSARSGAAARNSRWYGSSALTMATFRCLCGSTWDSPSMAKSSILSRRYWATSPWKSRCSLVTLVNTAVSNAHSANRCQRCDRACEVDSRTA